MGSSIHKEAGVRSNLPVAIARITFVKGTGGNNCCGRSLGRSFDIDQLRGGDGERMQFATVAAALGKESDENACGKGDESCGLYPISLGRSIAHHGNHRGMFVVAMDGSNNMLLLLLFVITVLIAFHRVIHIDDDDDISVELPRVMRTMRKSAKKMRRFS